MEVATNDDPQEMLKVRDAWDLFDLEVWRLPRDLRDKACENRHFGIQKEIHFSNH